MAGKGGELMPYPVVPETIRVHLGVPNAEAETVTVPFADYIKNVASHEIYPTWPESAIRANVLAQISYALNRVYTEYYPSRGYDFDVTSSTRYDQAYVYGGEVFENVSRIVDEIFNNYIVRQGRIEPLFAQFCDGVQTQCSGLSQWGSVALAQQGLVPYEILQYYYGPDINIVFNAPVGGNIPSYPGRPLRRGDYGEDVRILRRQLDRIGKNYPAIPAVGVAPVFDAATENAVKVFQEVFNLAADGVVGKATWYKVKDLYNSVKRLSDVAGEGITIPEAEREFPRVLRPGDSGSGVKVVQYYLAFLGFFMEALPSLELTGEFDEATEEAVRIFQSRYDLAADGIVGRDTWNKLRAVYAAVLSDLPPDFQAYAGDIYPGYVLAPGDEGESVRTFQEKLRRIAAEDPALPPVEVTGVFDAATENAVLALQRQQGVEETGVVGPVLWSDVIRRGSGY